MSSCHESFSKRWSLDDIILSFYGFASHNIMSWLLFSYFCISITLPSSRQLCCLDMVGSSLEEGYPAEKDNSWYQSYDMALAKEKGRRSWRVLYLQLCATAHVNVSHWHDEYMRESPWSVVCQYFMSCHGYSYHTFACLSTCPHDGSFTVWTWLAAAWKRDTQ